MSDKRKTLTSILMCLASFAAGAALSIWGIIVLKKDEPAPEPEITTTYPNSIQEAKDKADMLEGFLEYLDDEIRVNESKGSFEYNPNEASRLNEMYKWYAQEKMYLDDFVESYEMSMGTVPEGATLNEEGN